MTQRQNVRKLARVSEVAEAPREVVESPLYGVAMLKIAMELKKADARGLDEIVSGVLSKMHLSDNEFRAYLDQNGGMLRAIASNRGY